MSTFFRTRHRSRKQEAGSRKQEIRRQGTGKKEMKNNGKK
jgi:hypothetical protein